MRVYYSPLLKRYIDLDSITTISDAEFSDRMGAGGYYSGFEITLKLHDRPLRYWRKIPYRVIDSVPKIEMFNGVWQSPDVSEESEIKAVSDLQAEIEKLVTVWCGYQSKRGRYPRKDEEDPD
jgi:hypothetical protein